MVEAPLGMKRRTYHRLFVESRSSTGMKQVICIVTVCGSVWESLLCEIVAGMAVGD